MYFHHAFDSTVDMLTMTSVSILGGYLMTRTCTKGLMRSVTSRCHTSDSCVGTHTRQRRSKMILAESWIESQVTRFR